MAQASVKTQHFKEFYKPVPGGTDWLGFDDGSRALPADMPQHLNDYEFSYQPCRQR